MKNETFVRKDRSALVEYGFLVGGKTCSINALRRSHSGSHLHHGVKGKHSDTILCGQYSCRIGIPQVQQIFEFGRKSSGLAS